jgi:hypothetical protein
MTSDRHRIAISVVAMRYRSDFCFKRIEISISTANCWLRSKRGPIDRSIELFASLSCFKMSANLHVTASAAALQTHRALMAWKSGVKTGLKKSGVDYRILRFESR